MILSLLLHCDENLGETQVLLVTSSLNKHVINMSVVGNKACLTFKTDKKNLLKIPVTHYIIETTVAEKVEVLLRILNAMGSKDRALVFCKVRFNI